MSLMLLFGLSLVAAMVLAGWVIITAGNRLASLNARCETAFADIDVHLKRRYDLIPGLTECVRGFAAHEARILGEVVEARKASLAIVPEARQQVEATLGRRVGAVLSLAEKYPDLAASPHFRELRQELVATEERITASRRILQSRDWRVQRHAGAISRSPRGRPPPPRGTSSVRPGQRAHRARRAVRDPFLNFLAPTANHPCA